MHNVYNSEKYDVMLYVKLITLSCYFYLLKTSKYIILLNFPVGYLAVTQEKYQYD